MLARLLPRRPTAQRSNDPSYNGVFWSVPGGYGLTAAAYTNQNGIDDALKNAASWACIRVLVDALARSPMSAVRELNKVRTPVEPTPKILAQPSSMVALDVWRAQLGFSMVTDGNGFGNISETDAVGRPIGMDWLDATNVTDRKVVDGKAQVKVGHDVHLLYPYGPIFHVPGDLVMPGTPFALSPLTYAQKVLGTSLMAEDFSYRFFADGGHPPVALVSEVDMNGDQARDYKENWQRAMRGSREPVVMGSGMTVQELHLDPSETQFIDLMRFCVEQACRFWGVPPSMIFTSIGGEHMTYSNVTQADLHFLKHALEGKYVRLETAFSSLLPGNSFSAPSVPNTLAVIDRNAVLKADPATQFATQQIALENRFKTINEVRAENDDPPFPEPEFDKPGIPPFAPTQDPGSVDLNGKTPPPQPGF